MIIISIIISTIYFFIVGLGYCLLSEDYFVLFTLLLSVLFILTLVYSDRIVLNVLKSREVFLGPGTVFLQKVKHLSYKFGIPTPQVYLYKGRLSRAFALQSRSHMTLVFEEKILKDLNSDELDALIIYMLSVHQIGGGLKRTFSYLVCAMCVRTLHMIQSVLQKIIKNPPIVQSLLFIVSLGLRPIMQLMIKMAYSNKEVERLNRFLENELHQNHNLGSVITKLSYKNINRDLLDNSLLNLIVKEEFFRIDLPVIFETFPEIKIPLAR